MGRYDARKVVETDLLAEAYQKMNVALDDISEDFNAIDTRLNSIDTDLANVESTLATHKATLDRHETDIASLKTSKANVADLMSHINDKNNPHKVTKEQVGLGNVLNVPQVNINGDTMQGMLNLYSYTERMNTFTDTDPTLTPARYNVFVLTLTTNTARTINIDNTGLVSGRAHSFTLVIKQGASPASITFDPKIRWRGVGVPVVTNPNKQYVLSFMTVDNGATWLGVLVGEF